MTPLTIARRLLEDTYDYASTSIAAPPEVADFIQNWGKLNIPDDVIAGEEGRENHPHITVKYGLLSRELPAELKEIGKTTTPFPVFMGVISLFTTSPEHDVVKIDVESPWLRLLNKRVAGAVPHEDTYPTYNPHLTLAYVQKGTCDHLVGDDVFKTKEMPREFVAYGMTYSAPGEDDDPHRTKETLLFSKTAKVRADRLGEAVVGPPQAQMELIRDEIKSAVAESNGDPSVFVALANEALAPHGVQFQNHPELKGAPAVATDEGAYIRVPTAWDLQQPGWPDYVVAMMYHELVHGHQIARMSDPEKVVDKTTAWLMPHGTLDQERYLQQKQEIMAWAASMVDSWHRQGLTSDQMMTRLRSGNWNWGMKYWHNRQQYPQVFNRFVKQATEYIEQLKEHVFSQVETPDPFANLDFPADPGQTRQFLRNSGKWREARPIL